MLTSLFARNVPVAKYVSTDYVVSYLSAATGQWRSEHAMLTKSVKSAISVVLKHVAQAKKIRAISVICEL